jgi:hypothetical protein
MAQSSDSVASAGPRVAVGRAGVRLSGSGWVASACCEVNDAAVAVGGALTCVAYK